MTIRGRRAKFMWTGKRKIIQWRIAKVQPLLPSHCSNWHDFYILICRHWLFFNLVLREKKVHKWQHKDILLCVWERVYNGLPFRLIMQFTCSYAAALHVYHYMRSIHHHVCQKMFSGNMEMFVTPSDNNLFWWAKRMEVEWKQRWKKRDNEIHTA